MLSNAYIYTTENTMNQKDAHFLFTHPNKLKSLKRYSNEIYLEIVKQTNFLPEKALLKARLWHIINNINDIVTCKMCNNPVKWDDTKKSDKQKYRKYCSQKCLWNDPDIQAKKNKTMKDRYGEKLETIVKKTQKTNLQKYGQRYAIQTDIVKKKRNDTCIERYGVDNPSKVKEFIDKRKETNFSKFGHIYAAQSLEIKEKTKQTYIRNSGSIVEHYRVISNKTTTTMNEKYGFNSFSQTWIEPKSLIKLNDKEWLELQYKTKTLIEIGKILNVVQSTVGRYFEKHNIPIIPRFPISEDSKRKTNDKKWLELQYTENKLSSNTIADMLDVSSSLILKKLHQFEIPIQHFSTSIGEHEIREFLTSININFHPNDRTLIYPYELDFYIPEHNIAIEYNGNYWHSELCGKNKNYHLNKTKMCKERGVQLIHILESEWLLKQDIIKSRLSNMFKKNKSIYARKCQIVNVSKKTKKTFLNEHHLQGDVGSNINYGLMYNNELVATMTFGIPRFSKKYQYELLRFASKRGTNIVGGASRLMKHFICEHEPKNIITYGDLRYGTGNLYKFLGFDFLHNSSPNCHYFKNSQSLKLYSRIKFQKHKQQDLLEIFDPKLTAWKNMTNNDYNRIWDCGNSVWLWSRE